MRALLLLSLLPACAVGSGTPETETDPDARVEPTTPDAETPGAPDAEPETPPDAEVPDAAPAPDAEPPPDAPPIGGAVDTCAQALDITAAAMMGPGTTVTGDTTGYADDVHPASSCTGYFPDGPDAIYRVDAAIGDVITATATPTGWDISVYITSSCTLDAVCLAGADSDAAYGPETVTYTTTTAGIHYVIVDGYNPGVDGPYSLHVRLQ